MRVAGKIKRLLGNLFLRHRVEATLDAELRAYVEELTDRNIGKGMSREEARREALVEAGGLEQIKEKVRGGLARRRSPHRGSGPPLCVPLTAASARVHRHCRGHACAWHWRRPCACLESCAYRSPGLAAE